MIVVTGAAGFIGSCLISGLNQQGLEDIVAVDLFGQESKKVNYQDKKIKVFVDRNEFELWFDEHASEISFVYHIGARTDTTEQDVALFDALNLNYSKFVWRICSSNNIPLVYASSAATYGDGAFGYDDDESKIKDLVPLNPYGASKNDFDIWALAQQDCPPMWVGLKFFNVYGPNEYHKGRMASVIFHTYNQIKEKGDMRLFKSHRSDFKDGEQLRDFVYVKDLVKVCLFLKDNKIKSGIYNLGSGKARSFLDLASLTFKAVGKEVKIEFIDTPIDIRATYQYYTEANMQKLINEGYSTPFHTLEEGVADYVEHYLMQNRYL